MLHCTYAGTAEVHNCVKLLYKRVNLYVTDTWFSAVGVFSHRLK